MIRINFKDFSVEIFVMKPHGHQYDEILRLYDDSLIKNKIINLYNNLDINHHTPSSSFHSHIHTKTHVDVHTHGGS